MNARSHLCSLIILGFLNVWVIAANLLLHLEAKKLRDLPPGYGVIHGDQWVSKLLLWSIVAMVIGGLQTIVIIVYSVAGSKFEGNSQQTKKYGIAIVVVETVFIALALAAIFVPGVDQWPDTYIETNHAMYSLIIFIVAYGVFTLVTARTIFSPDNAGQVHVVYQPQVYQPQVYGQQQYNPNQQYYPQQQFQPQQPPMYQPQQPPMYQQPQYNPQNYVKQQEIELQPQRLNQY